MTDFKEEQYLKASFPIDVTLSGIVTDFKEPQSEKAPSSSITFFIAYFCHINPLAVL